MQTDAEARESDAGMKPPIKIREITIGDAEAAAMLSGELGYPAGTAEMKDRIAALAGSAEQVVYVACESNAVVGWIDVGLVHHLASDVYAEICGLVVSSGQRGKGVGSELVARAEQWTAERGVTKMVVRSRVTREDAHRFYRREGYGLTKTSAVFSKNLPGAG